MCNVNSGLMVTMVYAFLGVIIWYLRGLWKLFPALHDQVSVELIVRQLTTKQHENGIWLVVWNMNFIFPFSWEFHTPNWRTPSFFRGVGQPLDTSIKSQQPNSNNPTLLWFIYGLSMVYLSGWVPYVPRTRGDFFFGEASPNDWTFQVSYDNLPRTFFFRLIKNGSKPLKWHIRGIFYGDGVCLQI